MLLHAAFCGCTCCDKWIGKYAYLTADALFNVLYGWQLHLGLVERERERVEGFFLSIVGGCR